MGASNLARFTLIASQFVLNSPWRLIEGAMLIAVLTFERLLIGSQPLCVLNCLARLWKQPFRTSSVLAICVLLVGLTFDMILEGLFVVAFCKPLLAATLLG